MTAFVQIVASGTGTGINPLVLTLGAGKTTSIGNMVSAQCRMTAGKILNSVTDSQGNTWHVDVPNTAAGTGAAIASSMVTTPLTTGDTITFNFSGSCTPFVGVSEFSGVATSGGVALLDLTADLVNAVGTPVAPETAGTAAVTGELAITAMGISSGTATCTCAASDADTGGTWTQIAYGINSVGGAYQIGPGSLTKFKASWTASGGSNSEGVIGTYQPAGTPKSSTDVSAAGTEGAPITGVNDAVGFP